RACDKLGQRLVRDHSNRVDYFTLRSIKHLKEIASRNGGIHLAVVTPTAVQQSSVDRTRARSDNAGAVPVAAQRRATCQSSSAVKFGGSSSRSMGSELANLLARGTGSRPKSSTTS